MISPTLATLAVTTSILTILPCYVFAFIRAMNAGKPMYALLAVVVASLLCFADIMVFVNLTN